MLKNKFIKISASVIIVIIAFWVATPKMYINDLLHINGTSIFNDSEAAIESQSQETSDFDGDDKPVYFNIFKFVNNFIPVKPQN
jgi:hypothetical protein